MTLDIRHYNSSLQLTCPFAHALRHSIQKAEYKLDFHADYQQDGWLVECAPDYAHQLLPWDISTCRRHPIAYSGSFICTTSILERRATERLLHLLRSSPYHALLFVRGAIQLLVRARIVVARELFALGLLTAAINDIHHSCTVYSSCYSELLCDLAACLYNTGILRSL